MTGWNRVQRLALLVLLLLVVWLAGSARSVSTENRDLLQGRSTDAAQIAQLQSQLDAMKQLVEEQNTILIRLEQQVRDLGGEPVTNDTADDGETLPRGDGGGSTPTTSTTQPRRDPPPTTPPTTSTTAPPCTTVPVLGRCV